MRQHGIVCNWKDDNGFGFIKPDAGGKDVFLHISAIENATRRPMNGDKVEFIVTVASDGKSRAANVRISGATVIAWENPAPYLFGAFCVGTGIFLMMRTGLPFVLAYPVMGMITYGVYAHDKVQAQEGRFRVPEATLHALELLGGWLGGYIAQERLRHKTAKVSYQTTFWAIVILHFVGWAWWLYDTTSVPTNR